MNKLERPIHVFVRDIFFEALRKAEGAHEVEFDNGSIRCLCRGAGQSKFIRTVIKSVPAGEGCTVTVNSRQKILAGFSITDRSTGEIDRAKREIRDIIRVYYECS